jgi:hypothetical protein
MGRKKYKMNQLSKLSTDAVYVCTLLSLGCCVKHNIKGFTEGKTVSLNGLISDENGYTTNVSLEVMQELSNAKVPLYTYEHNEAEDWKTIIPLPGRAEIKVALAEIKTASDVIEVIVGLHKALSRMIDKHDPDSKEAEWLSHSNEVVRKLTGHDVVFP